MRNVDALQPPWHIIFHNSRAAKTLHNTKIPWSFTPTLIAYLEAAQKRLSLEYSEIQHNLSYYVDTIPSCVVTSFGHETWLVVQEGR